MIHKKFTDTDLDVFNIELALKMLEKLLRLL